MIWKCIYFCNLPKSVFPTLCQFVPSKVKLSDCQREYSNLLYSAFYPIILSYKRMIHYLCAESLWFLINATECSWKIELEKSSCVVRAMAACLLSAPSNRLPKSCKSCSVLLAGMTCFMFRGTATGQGLTPCAGGWILPRSKRAACGVDGYGSDRELVKIRCNRGQVGVGFPTRAD